MNANINNAERVLSRLSIIEKARALAWYTDVEFGDGVLVNVDKSGSGTERFYITHATIEGVYGYPKSDFYGTQDTDLLECWGAGICGWIERDADSAEVERMLDRQLAATGIDEDNPLVTNDYRYQPDAIIFKGTESD